MGVQRISAITLAVRDMGRAVDFYGGSLALERLYGGPDAEFTSFRVGDGYLNLTLSPEAEPSWWGRVILYVDDVDDTYLHLVQSGLLPDAPPQDAPWGERYFHIKDPDGHEISLAKPLAR